MYYKIFIKKFLFFSNCIGICGSIGGNFLFIGIGWIIFVGRGGSVYWGVFIIWGGCGVIISLLGVVGYEMGVIGCFFMEIFWCRGCFGFGVFDMVGIDLIFCGLVEEGGVGIGGIGRGWVGVEIVGIEVFVFDCLLGFGLVWRNG